MLDFIQNIITDTQWLFHEGKIWGVFWECIFWYILYFTLQRVIQYHIILDRLKQHPAFVGCLSRPPTRGILPKGPYLPCVSMAGRALLAGCPRYIYVYIYEVKIMCPKRNIVCTHDVISRTLTVLYIFWISFLHIFVYRSMLTMTHLRVRQI